jgi:hypothetical protein
LGAIDDVLVTLPDAAFVGLVRFPLGDYQARAHQARHELAAQRGERARVEGVREPGHFRVILRERVRRRDGRQGVCVVRSIEG